MELLGANEIACAISEKMVEALGTSIGGRVGSGGSTIVVLNKMIYFTSADLTKNIKAFTEEILDPALKNFQLEWDRKSYEVPGCLEFNMVMPVGVDFASMDIRKGLQVRVVRAYDVGTDTFPCRVTAVYR